MAWQQVEDLSGQPFWYDSETGATSYSDPNIAQVVQAQPSPTAGAIDWIDEAGQNVDLSKLGLSPEDEAWYREQAQRYYEGDVGNYAWMEPYRQLYGDPANTQSFWESQAGVDWLKTARAGGDAERDRQAAADNDSGFGGILGIALGIALMAFEVPVMISTALGVPTAVGSAITGSLTSLITGGNAAIGALTGAAGSFFGGGEAVASGAGEDFGLTGNELAGATGSIANPNDLLKVAQVSTDIPQGLRGEVSGPETTQAFDQFGSLNTPADAFGTQTVFDTAAQATPSGGGIISNQMEPGAFDQGQFTYQDVGLTPPSQQPNSFVQDIKNAWSGLSAGQGTLLAGGLAAGAGVFSGIGNRANAVELQKMKNAAALDQISATATAGTRAREDYLNYLRSLPGWKGRVGVSAPAMARPLRRPDGSLVYGPQGLITGAMRGG